MVERAPQTKRDEQYPLLKVDGGGGDGGAHVQPAPTLVTPGWGVTCAPKQSWLVRWPEYISTCWMTIILLGISFLVFYALGMEAYRRQPVLLIKCNGSKPASDVFFHQILPRGSPAPIMLYSEYLSNMAYQYPLLHFHVYFLIDDSVQNAYRVSRHPRFINSLIPMPLANTYPLYKLDENSRRDLAEFQRKFHNVNVTIMPLSKYMAMTPLKYKWRNIPLNYLTFYARVFSVWQYGGVGMELCTFNNYYNNRQHIDRRISAILKQHNDGIKIEDYTNALNKIDREEESELFSIFYGLIHSIFNETRTFFSNSFTMPQVIPENEPTTKNEPLIRLHRNKREVPTVGDKENDKSSIFVDILNSTNATDLKKNEYLVGDTEVNVNVTNAMPPVNLSFVSEPTTETNNKSEIRPEPLNKTNQHLVLFYDFSLFSDGAAPAFGMPEAFMRSDVNQVEGKLKYGNTASSLLSLDSEGIFVAASSRLHPFLGHLISAGCQRMHPKFAIQDTILTQCSGTFKEDTYCNNIYLL
ncbi:uncharacterized protein LOC142974628 [Anticarsia gemmatalis]|uniref:uncharacterized protein LOC142974628 n=1 Tax=Anticarsia gemmatalis TaxID=129554 RepID=UPI003F764445